MRRNRSILISFCLALALSFAPRTALPQSSSDKNGFALDLYRAVNAGDRNTILSPASIETALAMTAEGARGETAVEMRRVLHGDQGEVRRRAERLALALQQAGSGENSPELRLANALWVQKDFALAPEFVRIVTLDYSAGISPIDFAAPADAAGMINQWVARQTADKINGLVSERDFTTQTRMVLANAIYFKGAWERQFDKSRTQTVPFHKAGGSSSMAPLMNMSGKLNVLEGEDLVAAELPYSGGKLSMLVIVPKEVEGLAGVLRSLTSERLHEIMNGLAKRDANLYLPRFHVESAFSLATPLTALGMKRAFSSHDADFSGMTGRPDLYISSVVHKAFVDVSEEGTEAAAATAIIMAERSAMIREDAPLQIRADHPFLFAIVERGSGTPLFLGNVVDPLAR